MLTSPRWLRPPLAKLLALVGAGLTAVFVAAAWKDALREQERLYIAKADVVRERLVERIRATDEMITGLATLVNSATHVDADQFRLFSEDLLRRHRFLISTSYLPQVHDADRLVFETSRREAGFPGFIVSERIGADYRVAQARAEYFPLLFVEPFEPLSVTMIGFDVMSEPEFAAAARAAIDTALPTAAPPRLIDGRVRGYWLFAPIYAGKAPPVTTVERRGTVHGLVALRINGEELLAEAVAGWEVSARLLITAAGDYRVHELATRRTPQAGGRAAIRTLVRNTEIMSGGQRLRLELSQSLVWGDVNPVSVVAAFVIGVLMTVLVVTAARRAAQRAVQLEQRNREIEQRVAEQTAELALEKERAQVTLASIGEAVFTTDSEGRVEYMNAVAEQLSGWNIEDARGRALVEVLRITSASDTTSNASTLGPLAGDSLLVDRAGQEIAIDQSTAPIRGSDGTVHGSVVVVRDVSAQRKLAREITFQASHDALTGLFNRRAFEERLAELLESARTQGAQHALLYLDLDQFKIVNDACGHSAGDQLLRQLAVVMRKEVRQSDALARLGGDELGVLLAGCALAEAERVAAKLLEAVGEFRFVWKDRTFTIGVSIGVVPFGAEAESIAALLSAADAACYAAKDQGRNRVRIYQDDDVELSQRRSQMQWVTRLKRAVTEDEFVLYSQPIFPVVRQAGRAVQHEVLLRLREADGSVVLPGAFLPAAERYNLMPDIDRWVIRTTLRWLATHSQALQAVASYNVNVSGQSLSDPRFLDFVLAEFEASGVPPAQVCFEITETAAVANLDSAMRVITRLKERGCRFLLDDFGSGWSSFAYLKNLPVDYLKIDGSLVRDMAVDRLDEAMVRAINEIGHVMGISTIAEFVESDDVLARLAVIGVDYAQGYAIGYPVPIDDPVRAAPQGPSSFSG